MHNHNSFANKFTLLQIIPVILSNGTKNINTNALLDSGSGITLRLLHSGITLEVRSKLKLNGVEKKLNINNPVSKASEITIETIKNSETFSISSVCNTFDSSVDAYVVDELNICPNKVNIAGLKGKYPHLQNIYYLPLLQDRDSEVGILIGTDHADLLIHKEFCKRNLNEPVAVRYSLGLMLIGSCNAEILKGFRSKKL